MRERSRIRLFLDSNVLTGGLVSRWGLDKATLSLCAAKICRLVLSEAVHEEVEHNLVVHAQSMLPSQGDHLIDDYRQLLKLCRPEMVPYPSQREVQANRTLIRHQADVPILLSAIQSRPDWLLTHNTKHFTKAVAQRAGLRIATPAEFFRGLSKLFD